MRKHYTVITPPNTSKAPPLVAPTRRKKENLPPSAMAAEEGKEAPAERFRFKYVFIPCDK
jgi:hypothetical protein